MPADPPGDINADCSSRDPKRKRPTSGSTRGVANLTAEQLARKRANDREAQRAIRERTKNQIEHLHARIRDLESSQTFQDLQQALRDKEAVLAENREIKKRLAAVLDILNPLLGSKGSNGLNGMFGWYPSLTVSTVSRGNGLRAKADLLVHGLHSSTHGLI